MCNPSEISLFSNDLSRNQLWPEANVTTSKKEGKRKRKIQTSGWVCRASN